MSSTHVSSLKWRLQDNPIDKDDIQYEVNDIYKTPSCCCQFKLSRKDNIYNVQISSKNNDNTTWKYVDVWDKIKLNIYDGGDNDLYDWEILETLLGENQKCLFKALDKNTNKTYAIRLNEYKNDTDYDFFKICQEMIVMKKLYDNEKK